MVTSKDIQKHYKYLDLFAGAGGLSEGFFRAGFEPVAHIEMDAAACFSLKTRAAFHWLEKENKLNIYHRYLAQEISRDEFYAEIPKAVLNSVLNYEISNESLESIFSEVDKLLDGNDLDLIVGGPPCQAYSIAGRSRSETKMVGDKRNYLYKLYAEFLKRYNPTYFVFENVVGLLSAKDEDGTLHLKNMQELFKAYGYSTEFRQLNASDFGVLQNRKRIILIGYHGEKTNFYPNISVIDCCVKVGELFGDLPPVLAGEGVVSPVPTNHYSGEYLYESGIKEYDKEPVTFHQARPNIKRDLEIYRIVVDTWNKKKKRVVYIEFQKGRFDDVFHKVDSMYLWDDHFWLLDIESLFMEVLPEFDMFTHGCEINEEKWTAIVEASKRYSQITQQIVAEMDPWMLDAIRDYSCVTVIGV